MVDGAAKMFVAVDRNDGLKTASVSHGDNFSGLRISFRCFSFLSFRESCCEFFSLIAARKYREASEDVVCSLLLAVHLGELLAASFTDSSSRDYLSS